MPDAVRGIVLARPRRDDGEAPAASGRGPADLDRQHVRRLVEQGADVRASRVRVANPARTIWLLPVLRRTRRNQPVRASRARPAASCRRHRPCGLPSSPATRPIPRSASSLSPVRAADAVIAAERDCARRRSWRWSPRCRRGRAGQRVRGIRSTAAGKSPPAACSRAQAAACLGSSRPRSARHARCGPACFALRASSTDEPARPKAPPLPARDSGRVDAAATPRWRSAPAPTSEDGQSSLKPDAIALLGSRAT